LKAGYSLDTEEGVSLHEARESITIFLPKLLSMLRSKMGERYYINSSSEGRGRVFYFFAPRQPVDAFSLVVSAERNGTVKLSFGYMPYKATGRPDFANSVEETMKANAETAGLALMNLVRKVLSGIR
jgi:hypothetical protein